jgi:hypothetical protein
MVPPRSGRQATLTEHYIERTEERRRVGDLFRGRQMSDKWGVGPGTGVRPPPVSACGIFSTFALRRVLYTVKFLLETVKESINASSGSGRTEITNTIYDRNKVT